MRIAAMETISVNVPYRHAEVSSRVRRGGVTAVLVKLTTDTGLTGWGEACVGADAASIEAALAAMRPFVLGRDPWTGEAIARDVYRTGLWDYRVQTGNFAFAGIDMALWDLCGKACGQPLHRLFGGPVQEAIDYFYYLAQGTPEDLRAQCEDGVERGYSCFYLKVGIDAAAEEAMLEAVRAAVGGEARIRIDANEAWSVPEAVRLLNRWHERFGVDFAEAPVPIFPLERMRELRARTPVALCANEGLGSQADAYRVITGGVADIVCFSSYWVGTLRRFHTLASLAGLLGIGVCKHTHGELGIAASAAHHLILTLANATPGAQQTAAVMADDVLTAPLPIASGPRWGVPEAPGLGVEVDESKLAAFAEAYRRDGQFLPYAA
ncbi:MAG: mandelate racemase/muconate lactonizing enzyme family protein [Geminicoccaceae bacterium]